MRAVIYQQYGDYDVLHIEDVDTPTPASDEVRVRIHATTVTTASLANVSGKPFIARLASPNLGITRPKEQILGVELAGVVDAVGRNVSSFQVGDRVIAEPETGAFAEFICMQEDGLIARMPESTSFPEAAAACDAFLTAMPFLRDTANLRQGQHVLINGASASIGTAAIQIAKHFGAEVTGVCSSNNVELAASLGADHVIDYTQDDFTRGARTYDVIFDVVAKSSFGRCKRVLSDQGIYMTTFPTLGVFLPKFGGKQAKFLASGLRPPEDRRKDLRLLPELMDAGVLRTVIDRMYTLDQIVEAHRYVASGHKKGNVIVTVVP